VERFQTQLHPVEETDPWIINLTALRGRTAFVQAIQLCGNWLRPYLGFALSLIGTPAFNKILGIRNKMGKRIPNEYRTLT